VNVSNALIQCLKENRISTVFEIPGTQTLPLNESIEAADDIDHVMARHETAVSYQACGYAETSDEMAATLVIPGPRDMNAMNGLKNALNDCTPLLHLAIETEPEIRGGDGIHETPPETYDTVVKENILVSNPENAAAAIQRAISLARTPPEGPVRVGIPKNFLKRSTPQTTSGNFSRESVTSVPNDSIDAAIDVLAEAERPVIIAGGGACSPVAADHLDQVSSTLDAPVITTKKGKGAIPEDHEQFGGILDPGTNTTLLDWLGAADACLAVGTDLDAVETANWTIHLPEDLIHITLDETDIGRGYVPSIGIVADAAESLQAIGRELPDRRSAKPAGRAAERIRSDHETKLEPLRDNTDPPISTVCALETIREVLPEDTIVTADAGHVRLWTVHAFDVYGPQRYCNPGSWASMGAGFTAAIGAKVANPSQPVVSIMGDGGLMMCLHELHTVVSEEIPLFVLVFNNDGYYSISKAAEEEYGMDDDVFDWPDATIDFATVADGMGLESRAVETPDELRRTLTSRLDASEPSLIDIRVDPDEPSAKDVLNG
jgi:acetolactate synthase-1/2/3 large subunit